MSAAGAAAPLRVLFVHGQESGPQGTKARLLAERFETRAPQMDTRRFEDCVRQIAREVASFRPDVLVGSSFGGAVAVALLQRGDWRGPTLLLAPAPAAFGVPPRLPDGATVWIVHGSRDEVVPIAGSLALAGSGSPERVRLLEVRDDHRLSATVESGRLVALVRELAEAAAAPPRGAGERHVRVFFEEPALWPVVAAAAGGLAMMLAWTLATALRTRHPILLLVVAALVVGSVEPVRRGWRGRRPGLLAGSVLALWALGLAVAAALMRAGVF